MIETIFDLIDNLPNPIPANSVPYFDGCNWTLIQMPASTACNDILDCIDCQFVTSFLSSPNNSIFVNAWGVCWALEINPWFVNNALNSSWASPLLTIWNVTHDLSSIFTNNVFWSIYDWTMTFQVNNQDVLNIAWLDWLRFFVDGVAPNQQLVIWLPTESLIPDPNNQWAPIPGTRQHGQVLTWDAITGKAYWDNNQCCAQTLWLDEATETLHISWTNSVWLWVLNNQQLGIDWNTLCISQPSGASQCISLSETNNHTLETYAGNPALHYFVGLLNSNWVLQNQVSLEHMNNQALSITGNDLFISQPGGLTQWVDLSETNNHTLETYAGDATYHYFVGILNSNWVLQNRVSMEHLNNQVLSYDATVDANALNISQPGGWTQTVNLNRVNNHHMSFDSGTNVLSLWNSVNELMSTITLPSFDCDDVMACSWIQQIISDIAVLAGRVAAAENQIDNLRAELS